MTNTLSALALLVAVASPGASGDEALPGRDGDYALESVIVEGTTWEGKTDFGPFTVRFERGGILSYRTSGGTFRNGTWRLKGDVVYLEMNNHYADYHGAIRGDRISGAATNVKGMNWKWEVKRTGPAGDRR